MDKRAVIMRIIFFKGLLADVTLYRDSVYIFFRYRRDKGHWVEVFFLRGKVLVFVVSCLC